MLYVCYLLTPSHLQRIYIYIYIYIYYAYIYIYIYLFIYLKQIHKTTHICHHKYTHEHTHAHALTRMRTHKSIYIYIYIYLYMNTRTHTHSHVCARTKAHLYIYIYIIILSLYFCRIISTIICCAHPHYKNYWYHWKFYFHARMLCSFPSQCIFVIPISQCRAFTNLSAIIYFSKWMSVVN